MFINCRHCHALVATDPATDLPPERCPRCAGVLRRAGTAAQAEPADAASPASGPAPTRPIAVDAAEVAAPAPPSAAGARLVPDVAARLQPPPTSRVDAPRAPSTPDTAPTPALAPDTRATPPESAAATAPALPAAPVAVARALSPSGVPAPGPARADPAAAPDPVSAPRPQASGDAPVPTPEAIVDPAPAAGASSPPAPALIDPPAMETAQASGGAVPAQDAAAPASPSPALKAAPAPEASASRSGPGFLARQAAAARAVAPRRRAWRIAAIAGLTLLLAVQVLLADRARLAADARWRPLVAAACGALGCSLPPWREPSAFTLVSREVRPHPQSPDALRVRATLRNDARWAQAWPPLVLTLSDVDGRAVAARAFRAEEYLGGDAPALLAAGQSADIQLDIREPSTATVSYAFGFGD